MKNIKDAWNSGCDGPKLWQVYGKLVGCSSPHSARPRLDKLPDMKNWAYDILMEHRSEIVGHKLSKVEDSRLDRWTSVGYANQVVGHAGR